MHQRLAAGGAPCQMVAGGQHLRGREPPGVVVRERVGGEMGTWNIQRGDKDIVY